MTDPKWMIYGANGYTGKLIAEEARRCGLEPILAGRRESAIRPLADELGFDSRVFSLDDPDELVERLDDVDALLLAAGPFSSTSRPAVDACLRSNTHYLDITGEIAVFEECHARDTEARNAGIAIMPGVGFDVVPSDCLAATLAAALPNAHSLELAFHGSTASKGTAKTMIEGLPNGCMIRKDGAIVNVPTAWRTREVPFRDKTRTAISIPWGDVSTAYFSTHIPNIVVYMAMPKRMARAAVMARPLLPILRNRRLQRLVKRRIDATVEGPSREELDASQTQLWGRVESHTDGAVEATLVTPNSYKLTAMCAVEATQRVLDGGIVGAVTPSRAFGADFITEFPGCDLQIDGGAADATPSHRAETA